MCALNLELFGDRLPSSPSSIVVANPAIRHPAIAKTATETENWKHKPLDNVFRSQLRSCSAGEKYQSNPHEVCELHWLVEANLPTFEEQARILSSDRWYIP